MPVAQGGVDGRPHAPGLPVTGELAGRPRERHHAPERVGERAEDRLGRRLSFGQGLRAPDQEPEEAVREAVGALGLIQIPPHFLLGDVADDGHVGTGGAQGAVLVRVPRSPESHAWRRRPESVLASRLKDSSHLVALPRAHRTFRLPLAGASI